MADDYSPTIKDAARRINATSGRLHRIGDLIHDTAAKVPAAPRVTAPDIPASNDTGFKTVDGKMVVAWIADIVIWVRKRGRWQGQVTDGYRSVADQREACRHLCGNANGCPGRCAQPGTSNHQKKAFPGGAVDVTDYTAFGQEAAKYPGAHTVKNDLPLDRVHFSYTGH